MSLTSECLFNDAVFLSVLQTVLLLVLLERLGEIVTLWVLRMIIIPNNYKNDTLSRL